MHRFELTSDLLTGMSDIDNQHRALLDLANEVLYGDLDEEPLLFQRALSFLSNYIIYHFTAEEAAMTESGYPRARFHQEFHDRLRRAFSALVTQAANEGVSKALKLAIYFLLEDWLLYHIRETDRELAAFLRDTSPGGTIRRLPEIRPLKASGALPAEFDERVLAGVSAIR